MGDGTPSSLVYSLPFKLSVWTHASTKHLFIICSSHVVTIQPSYWSNFIKHVWAWHNTSLHCYCNHVCYYILIFKGFLIHIIVINELLNVDKHLELKEIFKSLQRFFQLPPEMHFENHFLYLILKQNQSVKESKPH